jgi:hypothetical protein
MPCTLPRARMASTRRTPVLAAVAATAALLAIPAVAGAVTYCVPNDSVDPSCDPGQGKATIQEALSAAQLSNAVADTVHIDAGSYSEAGLTYSSLSSSNLVTIEGEGTGATLLTIPNTTGLTTGLFVGAPAGSVVRNLAMTIPTNSDINGDIGIGLSGSVLGENLLVNGATASNARGVQMSSSAVLEDSTVDLPFASPSNTAVSGALNTVIRDSILHANDGARYGTVERSTISASGTGVSTDSVAIAVRNTLINLGTSNNAVGVQAANFNNSTSPNAATLDGVTIVGGGSNSTGVQARGDSDATPPLGESGDTNTDGESSTVTVSNTILFGQTRSLRVEADRGETATMTTSYSNYDSSTKLVTSDLSPGGGTGTASLTETNQTNHPPGFVSSSDFHLADTSALIDIGDPAHPPGGELDIDGDAREVLGEDGCGPRRDIGADEFVPASAPTVIPCPPETSILSGPDGPTNDPTPTFEFESSEASSTFKCKIDAGTFDDCTSPFTPVTPLAAGPHTFEVKAIDADANEDPTPASRSFSVDIAAPDTTILSGPDGPTSDATPTFTYDSTEASSTFKCSIDGGAFTACPPSGFTTGTLADGPHSFAVKAIDPALNEDPSPDSNSFTVDTAAPDTTFLSGPSGPTSDPTPTFGFESSEPSSTFQCSIDGAAFVACSSPFTTPAFTDGSHTVAVRATDAALNQDATPATRSFSVDATAPDTSVSGKAKVRTRKKKARVSWILGVTDPGATIECSLDGGPFVACSSPFTVKLRRGAHTLSARARDALGNVDASPASFTTRVKRKLVRR